MISDSGRLPFSTRQPGLDLEAEGKQVGGLAG